MKKLKILLITGNKSFDEIRLIADRINDNDKLSINCSVKKIDIEVSAFISENLILTLWNNIEDKNFDLILISGFIPWDSSHLGKKMGINIYKGTRFSGNLYELLTNIRNLELSTLKAADSLLNRSKTSLINDYISEKIKVLNKNIAVKEQRSSHNFLETDEEKKYYGGDFPPLLFAEIVNAPKMKDNEIFNKVNHFINSGADIIDIGTMVNEDNSKFIRNIIPLIKDRFNIPISIDSVDIKEIIAGIDSGVDFILSIDGGNIDEFLDYSEKNPFKKDIGIVLIPLDSPTHKPVKTPSAKIILLNNLAQKLHKNGFNNLLYDPLLNPPITPGFLNSIETYLMLKKQMEDNKILKYPIFMGFNNVFELIDSDSMGINVLLSIISIELNCGGILSTEFSVKSLGSIMETRKGIDLAYLAKISESPPINIGINAFSAKNKRKSSKLEENFEITVDLRDLKDSIKLNQKLKKKLENELEFIHDSTGYFKVYTNYYEKIIELVFYPSKKIKATSPIDGPLLIKGRNAESIYKTLTKLGIVSELTHAFYLGKELSKAEYSLFLNSPYFEDIDFD